VSVTASTSPRWNSTVTVPLAVSTTASPCSALRRSSTRIAARCRRSCQRSSGPFPAASPVPGSPTTSYPRALSAASSGDRSAATCVQRSRSASPSPQPVSAVRASIATSTTTRTCLTWTPFVDLGPRCRPKVTEGSGPCSGFVSDRGRLGGQGDGEPGPALRGVAGVDGAAQPPDQPRRERQPQPAAHLADAAVTAGQHPTLEDDLKIRLGEPGSAVAHLEDRAGARTRRAVS